ncbi:MAG: hypothetical protein GY874_10355 [Desulfobacteraceae bacterium]|nr:hypothetical protein [Desulfobacteraceae bacterium]
MKIWLWVRHLKVDPAKEDTMLKKLFALASITAFVIMATGCTGTPKLKRQWGKSVKTAKQLQIINPEAQKATIQPPEMEGRAAGYAGESYQQSFKQVTAK